MKQRLANAAIATLVVYITFLFLNVGTNFEIHLSMLIELFLFFFCLLGNLWIHKKISILFHSKPLPAFNPQAKTFVEALTVVSINLLLVLVFAFILYGYIFFGRFSPEDFHPDRIRLAFVVSSIISLFFYYFIEREQTRKKLQLEVLKAERLQKQNLEAQLELLKKQVDPHFLFNNLNILRSLMRKDLNSAMEFLTQLCEVYRAVLSNNDKILIPLQDELILVKAYIYLMKTRFDQNIQFQLNVPVELMTKMIPPTTLQMLIENAIKHNGFADDKPLIVQIYSESGALVVQNNYQPRKDRIYSTKKGLDNITGRYRHLTNQQVVIEQNKEAFIARVPLI